MVFRRRVDVSRFENSDNRIVHISPKLCGSHWVSTITNTYHSIKIVVIDRVVLAIRSSMSEFPTYWISIKLTFVKKDCYSILSEPRSIRSGLSPEDESIFADTKEWSRQIRFYFSLIFCNFTPINLNLWNIRQFKSTAIIWANRS